MKTSWDDLHTLIHAMTPAEKGYFKKFNAGFSGAHLIRYQKLFDAMAGMKLPDADLVEKKFSSTTKNIYSLRNFLQKQILKSLRMYHLENDVSFLLRDSLDTISILNAKGLHKQSNELIEKGLTTAQKYGMTNYSILFLTEKRQQLKFYAETKRNELSHEIRKSLLWHAKAIINKEFIKEAHLKSIYWINTYSPLRDPEVRIEAEQLYENLKNISEEDLTGHNEINLQYAALANICSLLNKRKEAINYQEKTIRLMDGLDIRKMNRVLNYAAAIYNICILTLIEKESAQTTFWLKKLRSIETANEAEQLYIKALAIHVELFLQAINHADYNEGLVEKIEIFLLQEHPVPNVFYDTQLLLLNYYIQHNNWQSALRKSFLLINTDYRHSQVSFHVHVRLLNILVHYKLGNLLLLPSLIRSTYRYIRKLNFQFALEKLLLKFFSKLLTRSGSHEIRSLFGELYADLELLFEDEAERNVQDIYFNYHEWLKRELGGGQ